MAGSNTSSTHDYNAMVSKTAPTLPQAEHCRKGGDCENFFFKAEMYSPRARIGQSHPNQLPDLSSVMVIAALVLSLQLQASDCLECYCSAHPPTSPRMVWGSCATNGTCFIKVTNSPSSSGGLGHVIQRGCVAEKLADAFCKSDEPGSEVACCHSNRCNGNLRLLEKGGRVRPGRRRLLQQRDDAVSMVIMEGYNKQKTITIATVVACVLLVTVIIALVITLATCYLFFHHGRRHSRSVGDLEDSRHMVIGNCCSAIVPQGETLSSLLLTSRRSSRSSSPSSSLSLLVQRAIVRSVVLDRSIGRGKFSESYVGRWRRERVTVKIYPHAHERMWYSETLLYQIPHMCHAHISPFIAADYRRQSPSGLRHYLITEYHERGTLFEYLSRVTLDVGAVLVLAQSAASGLAHLHTEVRPVGGAEKASIVHRNISSSCFWVKNDGTCCLGDLSLAIKEDSNFISELKSKPLGHTHYLSPELLEGGTRSHENITFELLKKADVYAWGLVMWEIARRCNIHGSVESAELPFSAAISTERPVGTSSHSSLEQMRMAVLSRRLRPPLAEHWSFDDRMQSYVQLFIQCWDDNATCRPSAMTTKNSLDKLLLPTLRIDQKANCKITCED